LGKKTALAIAEKLVKEKFIKTLEDLIEIIIKLLEESWMEFN